MSIPARRAALASLASLALAAAPAAASPPAVAVSDVTTYHFTSPLAPPRSLRLAGSNGGITVSTSTDGKLDVRAVASDGDASRLRIVTREEPGGVAVCVLFADEPPEACQLGGVDRSTSGGHGHHNEATVGLVALVPPGVRVGAETLNGAIRVRGMTGEVRATTLNGDVEISAGTVPEATTLNGNVMLSLASALSGRMTVTTNNGNVQVSLPGGVNADLDASTLHGEIRTSFPMTIDTTPGGFGPKSGHGRIGSGGARIQAKTNNGNIDVKSGA